MVKAGKFGHRGVEFAGNQALSNYGLNTPIKRLWYGTVTKITAAAATQRLNVRGPTWGFNWIEYAEIHSRSYHVGGTFAGAQRGTVCRYVNISPTLRLPATLGVGTKSIFVLLWGR